MSQKKRSDEFFAAVDSDRIAGVLNEKAEDWYKTFRSSVHYGRMSLSYQMYYGLTKEGSVASSGIRQVGPRGEYALMANNHFRNNLQHVLVMTTAQRPALECKAANNDADAIEQCNLGNSLLEWYMRDKKVERFLRDACEFALVLSEGFVAADWETSMGEIVAAPPGGHPIREGDIQFSKFTPMDVIRDMDRQDSQLPWVMVLRWKNRFQLAAKYSERAEEILNVDADKFLKARADFYNESSMDRGDLIPELTFYHEKNEAMPNGRLVRFVGSDTLLMDAPLPVTKVPVFRISPSDMADTPWGYTPAFDALSQQEALNLIDSTIMTNQKTFGVGCIKAPEGNNIQVSAIAEGLKLITVNETNGKLEPINFTSTPKEVFEFREIMRRDQEQMFGVNSVVKGDPQSEITSGSFAALIASQAVQFNSGLQSSYNQLAEDVGGMIIEMLQKFAHTERVGKIVGKNKQYMLKSFSSKDLKNIRAVVVEQSNPIKQTNAGRMKMAEDLINMGFVKRPQQYITVLESGRYEPVVENEETALNNIRRENEMIRQGQVPATMATDDHAGHILEHRSVADDPNARQDPKIMQALTQHLMEHKQVWEQMPPDFLQALGMQPLFNPMMMGGMPPAPGGAMTPEVTGAPQPIAPAALPSMPSMPTNPQTGEQFQPLV